MSVKHPADSSPVATIVIEPPGFKARLRYYWTLIVAALCFVFIGIPIIIIGYLLRWLFGIEDFIHPFAKFGCRLYLRSAGARIQVSGIENLTPG
ncbi:MAG: hypothetical protein ABI882_24565, partial [Acidobacteriota bacterium]